MHHARVLLLGLLALLVVGLSPEGAEAATTSTASLSNTEVQPDADSFLSAAAMDLSGLHVAFYSAADNLAGADGTVDIFVRTATDDNGVFSDTGDTNVLISQQSDEGAAANGHSGSASISPLGRFVVFASLATNLPQSGLDTNGVRDIFLRDRDPDNDGLYDEAADPGSTSRTSVSSSEAEANGHSRNPVISLDGDYVAFESDATNLVGGDTNLRTDVFVRDRDSGVTAWPSLDSCENQANGHSVLPSIEYNGQYVSFQSDATDLDRDADNNGVCEGNYDTNGFTDIFLRNRNETEQLTYRVSVPDNASLGTQGNGRSFDRAPLSLGGRFVVFRSSASNLVSGDTNGVDDIFVRDLDEDNDGKLNESGATGTVRLSVDSDENESNGASFLPSISREGRYVAFVSNATNLVGAGVDTNLVADVFVRDRDPDSDGDFYEPNAYTVRASLSTSNAQADGASSAPGLSLNRRVAFESVATNLVGGDANGMRDVFVRSLDGDGDTILEPFDNCPAVANGPPGVGNQTDTDSDGPGDACDNCPSDSNPAQTNTDVIETPPGDALGDVCDPDDDNDGWSDVAEGFLATLTLNACSDTAAADDEAPDPWPPDANDNQVVEIDDVFFASSRFGQGTGGPNYSARAEIGSQNGSIDIDDVFGFASRFGQSCT